MKKFPPTFKFTMAYMKKKDFSGQIFAKIGLLTMIYTQIA
jgi:hypothetical protein